MNDVSKCPVMHGAVTSNSGSGTSNRDWWPNQLNLNILHQHDRKSNPLDEEFNVRLDKENVTDEDPGLPYHADLVYNWTPEEGKTAPTAIKRLAKKLAKNPPTEYFPDKDVEIDEWTGSPMKQVSIVFRDLFFPDWLSNCRLETNKKP